MISSEVFVGGTDPEAFALSINQAVEYTSTRIPPTAPDLNRNFGVFQPVFGCTFPIAQRQIVPQPRLVPRNYNAGNTSLEKQVLLSQQQQAQAQARAQRQGPGQGEGSPQLPPMPQQPPQPPQQPIQRLQTVIRPAQGNPDHTKPATANQAGIPTIRVSPPPLHPYTYTALAPPQTHPINPLTASTIHPTLMQRLRLNSPKLYRTSLSRELRNPRPRTPQCPPPIPRETLMRYEVQMRSFYYRQGLAWQFLGELEENGWVGWERTMVDVEAIARDLTENSAGGGAEVVGGEEIAEQGDAGGVQAAQQVQAGAGTQDAGRAMAGQEEVVRAPIVRYTVDDEMEEEESESESEREGEEPESESQDLNDNVVAAESGVDGDGAVGRAQEGANGKRVSAGRNDVDAGAETEIAREKVQQVEKTNTVEQARRNNNKRISYFLADMVIEWNRIKEMGF